MTRAPENHGWTLTSEQEKSLLELPEDLRPVAEILITGFLGAMASCRRSERVQRRERYRQQKKRPLQRGI